MRWLDAKRLVSVGGAPGLRGAMATWDAAAGKPLSASKKMPVGTVYAVAVSADGKRLALGTGGTLRAEKDYNTALILNLGK